jgi:PilZ domain-containing protein
MSEAPLRPVAHESRRSSRVRLKARIEVQRLGEPLACDGETIVVNRHGALIWTGLPLRVGLRIKIEVHLTGKRTQADVVHVDPQQSLHCGIALTKPENIWGLSLAPDDWIE